MNIPRDRLQQIIIEEYFIEEGILTEALSQERFEEFMAWVNKRGPRPEWLDRDYGPGSYKRGKQTPASDSSVDRSAETMPFPADDMPQYDDVPDEEGAYDTEAEAPESRLEDQIASLVQGMPAEEVSDLFQAVFSKIPGVEIGPPEEEEPDTLYSPGAAGRPVAGFQLEELVGLIREVLEEGHYHDMGGEDEMYDALDPHGFDKMSDYELIDAMETDGMEDMIVRDGEGGLANREEVIAALKDV
jgi:hypothetical protein